MESIMVGPLQMANGLVSLLAAALLSGLVLNPRINEGIVVKIGLVAMIWGLLGTAYLTLAASQNWDAVWHSGVVTRAGLVIVCSGVWWRSRK